jgi:hypothetical protein
MGMGNGVMGKSVGSFRKKIERLTKFNIMMAQRRGAHRRVYGE